MNRIASLLCFVALPGLFLGCLPSKDDKVHGPTAPADTDGDGLTDDDEAAFGTDPALPDTDGDGLLDLDEYNFGTDGTVADTDLDTYTDFDEINFGTNPLDPESRIYIGYWPYHADKDLMVDPGWKGGHHTDDPLPRFAWLDQFGDTVDIYDFAHQGKYVVIDLSGMWCGYCTEMAKWLEGSSDYYDKFGDGYENIPGWVADGVFYWVTVVDSDSSGAAADESTVKTWARRYSNDKIPVLLDPDFQMATFEVANYYPSVMLLDENLNIAVFRNSDYTKVLTELVDLFGKTEKE